MNGERSMETYTLLHIKQTANGNVLCDSANSGQGCDKLEGWEGMGGGREVLEGGDRCAPMTESPLHSMETKPLNRKGNQS